jgi:hypothetical protein
MKTPIRTTLAVVLSLSASSSLALAQTSVPRLSLEGRVSAARREYNAIAELQRSNNVLPSEAMWKLAELYNSEKDDRRTATILHELAMDAERFGDPQLQARALLEATILYNKANMKEKAIGCASRLDLLMASPFVSDELRAEVKNRIRRK